MPRWHRRVPSKSLTSGKSGAPGRRSTPRGRYVRLLCVTVQAKSPSAEVARSVVRHGFAPDWWSGTARPITHIRCSDRCCGPSRNEAPVANRLGRRKALGHDHCWQRRHGDCNGQAGQITRTLVQRSKAMAANANLRRTDGRWCYLVAPSTCSASWRGASIMMS